jgi:hypothetical protein
MSNDINFGMEPTRLGRGLPVRIGDAERDGAIAALSEHFAAGRLSREELDERVEQAMGAKFDADLVPLLADLPSTLPPQPLKKASSAPPVVQLLWSLMPLLLVAVVVTALVTGVPWLLWSMLWIFMMTGYGNRRAHLVYQRQHHHQPR